MDIDLQSGHFDRAGDDPDEHILQRCHLLNGIIGFPHFLGRGREMGLGRWTVEKGFSTSRKWGATRILLDTFGASRLGIKIPVR